MTAVCELAGVGRTYGDRYSVTALRDVDLRIASGEFISVMGPSGSGKSTLLHILGLLDSPSTGAYSLAGRLTSQMGGQTKAKLRAETIGFVFQSFHLISAKSALDNVVLGMAYQNVGWGRRYALAADALERLGLDHRMTAYPETLSGGERQRLAIARAVAGEKRLLLCDEPTGNLDRENTIQFLEIVAQLNDTGLTVVVVTHDPEVADAADRSLIIRDGVLTEAGG
jgi:putative ABC transport system ATP-binding protein